MSLQTSAPIRTTYLTQRCSQQDPGRAGDQLKPSPPPTLPLNKRSFLETLPNSSDILIWSPAKCSRNNSELLTKYWKPPRTLWMLPRQKSGIQELTLLSQ